MIIARYARLLALTPWSLHSRPQPAFIIPRIAAEQVCLDDLFASPDAAVLGEMF
jgi:hypothetical protein